MMSIPYDSHIALLQQEELELRYALATAEMDANRLFDARERAVLAHENARAAARQIQSKLEAKALEIENAIGAHLELKNKS